MSERIVFNGEEVEAAVKRMKAHYEPAATAINKLVDIFNESFQDSNARFISVAGTQVGIVGQITSQVDESLILIEKSIKDYAEELDELSNDVKGIE